MKRVCLPGLAVLLFLAPGCARYVSVADGPKRSMDVADDLVRAESWTMGKSVNLHVERGTRVENAQDFVRQRAARDLRLLGNRDPRYASVDLSGEGGEAVFMIAGYILVGVLYAVWEGVEFVAVGVGEITGLVAPRTDGRITETWMDVRWEPSPSATLDAADGGPPIDLGPQPPGGYDLGPDILDRLGPPDRPVVIHDGPRSTSLIIRRFK